VLYKTKVIEVEKRGNFYFIELEKCEFYPDGAGGQLGDRGKINGVNVLEVVRDNGRTKLKVDGKLEKNKEYSVEIFDERRFDIAQQHTAQHILSRAFEDLVNLSTVSFHMGEKISTIDLDTSFIDWTIVEKAEKLSNEVVWKNLPVEVIYEEPDNLEKYKLRKISEKIKNFEKIRLIKIGDFDVCACGGFHVGNTGQVGLIKILHFEKVKGKYMRLEYVAGKRALDFFKSFIDRERKLFEVTKATKDDLILKVQKLFNETKEQRKKITLLVEDLKEKVLKELEDNAIGMNNLKVYSYSSTTELIEILASVFQKIENSTFIGFDIIRNSVIIVCNSKNLNAGEISRELTKHFNGKGGGSQKRANVLFQKVLTPEIINKVKKRLLEFLESKIEPFK